MSNEQISSINRELNDNYGWAGASYARKRFEHVSYETIAWILMVFDAVFIISTSALLKNLYIGSESSHKPASYFGISVIGAIVAVLFFRSQNLYRIERIANAGSGIAHLVKYWTLLFLGFALIGVLDKSAMEYSRLWFVSWYALGLLILAALRILASSSFRRAVAAGVVSQSVVVIGATELTLKMLQLLAAQRYGIKVAAVFDDRSARHPEKAALETQGNLDDLLLYQKTHRVDFVVIAAPQAEAARLRRIVRMLSVQAVKIRILPSELALEESRKWLAPIGEIPGLQLMPISEQPISWAAFMVKSLFDRIFAVLALILFAPVMLGCAIGIKIVSPGPVLFRQKRIGYRNEIFYVYKFRSMHLAADQAKLTERNDPRIFAFGQILRKLSLDELPQHFNVLKGEMSLVGPRPHMPEARAAGRFYFDVVDEYGYRHRVKPGITGWAQVNGWRGPTETVEQIEQRFSHDLYYIDNWSLIMDIKIIFKTVLVGFFGKNAF